MQNDSKTNDFDVIVVGSGFGGSVMTCRLAERGQRVCLLERGKSYGMHSFPRRMDEVREGLFWDPRDRRFGFMEFRAYPESDVFSVCASGLGGGSLIYANVLMPMPEDFFEGWPGGITRKALDPYYDRALEMLEGVRYPIDHPYYADTPKAHLFRKAAESIKAADDSLEPHSFEFPHIAVRFEGDFPGQQSTNKQGKVQSSCIKCGECDIGCNIHAKNTLDLNYIARAQNEKLMGRGSRAADVRTNAEVLSIEPLPGEDYRVTYRNPDTLEETRLHTKRVVLAAGCIGTNKILLRMKRDGLLPRLSDMLGKRWCGNGDLEGTVLFAKEAPQMTIGPVITGAVQYRFQDYPDGFKHGMVLQEAGIPSFLAWFVAGRFPTLNVFTSALRFFGTMVGRLFRYLFVKLRLIKFKDEINYGDDVSSLLRGNEILRRSLVLLGMGRDRSDGEVLLREDGEPIIRWRKKSSDLHYRRVRREMKKIARALGGKYLDNPLTYLDRIIAVHPLGGCAMAESKEEGVVNPDGEAFGHPGLYVVDASIIPTSIGPNPSLTITALAERMAERFPDP